MTKGKMPYYKNEPLGLTDTPLIKDVWVCPLTGEVHNAEAFAEGERHLEMVRQQCVREYSSSPLYQAAAAKDPEYWNNFSMGQVHLYEESGIDNEDDSGHGLYNK